VASCDVDGATMPFDEDSSLSETTLLSAVNETPNSELNSELCTEIRKLRRNPFGKYERTYVRSYQSLDFRRFPSRMEMKVINVVKTPHVEVMV
jgi:hypothetical protein